ncbi:hypothetical protein BS78_05G205800 [Paspalum vaginatum]|nr:hypothetical protein BS78_05G205800 [Paspalum vaginatum]
MRSSSSITASTPASRPRPQNGSHRLQRQLQLPRRRPADAAAAGGLDAEDRAARRDTQPPLGADPDAICTLPRQRGSTTLSSPATSSRRAAVPGVCPAQDELPANCPAQRTPQQCTTLDLRPPVRRRGLQHTQAACLPPVYCHMRRRRHLHVTDDSFIKRNRRTAQAYQFQISVFQLASALGRCRQQ